MTNAINKIATKYGLTADNTNVNTSIDVNRNQTAQTSGLNFLKQMNSFTDHLGYFQIGTTTIKTVDILTGITPIQVLEPASILSQRVLKRNNTIKEFTTTVTRRNPIEADNKTPQLKDEQIQIKAVTGRDSGDTVNVQSFVEPTALSGGLAIYSYTNISLILARKAQISQLQQIEVILDGYLNIPMGQRVSFEAINDNERVQDGSGEFTVTRISYNESNITTKLEGVGTYTPIIK